MKTHQNRSEQKLKKNMLLNKWLWKWHFIAGIICIVFALLFSITGIIYLFRDDYEVSAYQKLKQVQVEGEKLSLQAQWDIVNANVKIKPNAVVLSDTPDEATEFRSGMHASRVSTFIDPYSGKINGQFAVNKSLMYYVRKLHSELLMGSFGGIFTELAGSWMIVLVLTGIYLWWPKAKWRARGFFTIRTGVKKRLVWRDIHVVTSFWISIVLLLTVVSGMPFTSLFGNGYKLVMDGFESGYPDGWQGRGPKSTPRGTPLSLDDVATIVKGLQLEDQVVISLPRNARDVYRISNSTEDLSRQKMVLMDQYSGQILEQMTGSAFGSMLKIRQWLIRLHEAKHGKWSWWLMLAISVLFMFTSIAAVYSYIYRKRKGSWGVPKSNPQQNFGIGVFLIIIVLGVIFPLFGISFILIWVYEKARKKKETKPIELGQAA